MSNSLNLTIVKNAANFLLKYNNCGMYMIPPKTFPNCCFPAKVLILENLKIGTYRISVLINYPTSASGFQAKYSKLKSANLLLIGRH